MHEVKIVSHYGGPIIVDQCESVEVSGSTNRTYSGQNKERQRKSRR